VGRLRIVNETLWNTRDVRRFTLAGLKAEVGEWWGTYLVEVKHLKRGQNRRGWGYVGRNHMCLFVRKPKSDDDMIADCYLESLAVTLAHEADHNKGEKSHRVIDDGEREIEWVGQLVKDGFVLHSNLPKRRPVVDVQAKRAVHAQKMLETHESKLKREQKLVRKWRQKVRYYDKALSERDPDHVEKVAAKRAARVPFSPRLEAERLAEEQGVEISYWDERWCENHITMNAPCGYSWGGLHSRPERGWRDALKVLRTETLDKCDEGCDVCSERGK